MHLFIHLSNGPPTHLPPTYHPPVYIVWLYVYLKVLTLFLELHFNLDVLKLHMNESKCGSLLFFLTLSEAFHSEDLNLPSTRKICLLFFYYSSSISLFFLLMDVDPS